MSCQGKLMLKNCFSKLSGQGWHKKSLSYFTVTPQILNYGQLDCAQRSSAHELRNLVVFCNFWKSCNYRTKGGDLCCFEFSEGKLINTRECPMDKRTIKTPNPICRIFFKIDLLTEFAALCLTDVKTGDTFTHWLVFSTQLVNCCLHDELYSCTVAPISSLWPPPPLPN
jgi:hypothetical protein